MLGKDNLKELNDSKNMECRVEPLQIKEGNTVVKAFGTLFNPEVLAGNGGPSIIKTVTVLGEGNNVAEAQKNALDLLQVTLGKENIKKVTTYNYKEQ